MRKRKVTLRSVRLCLHEFVDSHPASRSWAIASLVASVASMAHAWAIGWYGTLTLFSIGLVLGWATWIIPAGVTVAAVTMAFVRGRWKWMAILALVLAPIGSFGSCWGGLIARGECERGDFLGIECRKKTQEEIDGCPCKNVFHRCAKTCSGPLVSEGCCECPPGTFDLPCTDASAE